MKRNIYYFLFTVVIVSISGALQAQISKGSSLLGGSINLSSGKNETHSDYLSKSSSFTVTPSYGKFIKQNLAVGGDLSYGNVSGTYKSSGGPEQTQKTNAYGLGVYFAAI